MVLQSIPAWSAVSKTVMAVWFAVLTLSQLIAATDTRTPRSMMEDQIAAVKPQAPARTWSGNKVMILCYHDVPTRYYNKDPNSVDLFSFVRELEFMRDYGCHFVSVKDILDASQGKKKLPEKAVLLTFDDCYPSFYTNIYPLLKIYNYPCMLAIIAGWIDRKPEDPELKDYRFMNWAQLKEVSQSGLVELASHSMFMHRAVQCNPQGNTAHAMITLAYDPVTKTYETEAQLRKKIYDDLVASRKLIQEKTGKAPIAMVWPYGRYNSVSLEEAVKAGFKMTFTLDDGVADTGNIIAMPRYMIQDKPTIEQFSRKFKVNFVEPPVRQRFLQTDLDLIYDKDPVVQEKNLDAFVERIYRIKPSAVFLQAFSDIDADGNIGSVYFPNRVLPMKADLFNRVSRVLTIRGIQVYAWLPTLCIKLPNQLENDRLRARELRDGKIQFPTAWYQNRLSPFSPEAVEKLKMLYADLAINSLIDGVIFQDDGYLNDFEDFSPEAMKEYLRITGGKMVPFAQLDAEQKREWTKLKTDKLMALTDVLKKQVLYYRPFTMFARTIYATVVTDPNSEEWFAQNYVKCLKDYDYTVIMSYPKMDKISNPTKWLRRLVAEAGKHPDGIRKTVFKVQTYDWEGKAWIPSGTVLSWLRTLSAAGAWNLAYYPDDYTVNEPKIDIIKQIMSTIGSPEIKGIEHGLYP